ncbi:MAG TPA: LacI family DNA-binding transcriptional regulator [Armatimonadota bacterium]|nr:LacI family DNA-binding transcriptional regulator [Armatimonadota bacterium]
MDDQRSKPHKGITADDVAKMCGVHRSTVRRVMCNDPRISTDTAKRVWAAARKVGYNPTQNTAARRLALQRQGRSLLNYLIGCVVPVDFQEATYFSEMYRGILRTLEVEEFALLTSYYNLPEIEPLRNPIPPALIRGDADGLILIRTRYDFAPFLAKLREAGNFVNRPVVTLMHTLPDLPAILTDDKSGAYAVTKHLLELGHRYFLQMVVQDGDVNMVRDENMVRRLAGIHQALAEYDLDPGTHLQQFVTPLSWTSPFPLEDEVGEHQVGIFDNRKVGMHLGEYLRIHSEITAIMGINDACAIRAWRWIEYHGWHIPDDYSIVGFDDTDPILNAAHKNSLTSVRLPLKEAGYKATKLLLKLINTGETHHDPIILPTKLMIRESTAQHHHPK